MILLVSGVVLLLTCLFFMTYELFTYRESTRAKLATLGRIIAANSTAALAFNSPKDAAEILAALRTETHITAACLFDENGNIFATYPVDRSLADFPGQPQLIGYRYEGNQLVGFQPVYQDDKKMGMLYLEYDITTIYERLILYSYASFIVIGISFLLAYILSRKLQKQISEPILTLAQTAVTISQENNYTTRAESRDEYREIRILTRAFNHMLTQIELKNSRILSFSDELKQKVKLRTSELEAANKSLEQTNDQLKKSNHDLEQYAYIASHDLQEPLRKIQTFSELAVRHSDKNPEIQLYLEKIRSSAARMSALIQAVLNYSRLSYSQEPFQSVDMEAIARNIETDFELLLQEKNGQIQIGNLPVIRGNPLQLHQLFYNMVSNALKFSDKNPSIRIDSSIVSKSPEKNAPLRSYHEIIFQDQGVGFEQKYADKIFTIFQRIHDPQNYPGTGIGLALCKKIVENHGGWIEVSSQPEKGTTFFVYLPINEHEAEKSS